MQSHYERLRVGRDATEEQIRAAYAAERSSTANPAELDAALEILSDPLQRAAYDAELDEGAHPGVPTTPASAKGAQPLSRDERSAPDLARGAFAAGRWAGFWRRYIAALIDLVILLVIAGGPAYAARALIDARLETSRYSDWAYYGIAIAIAIAYQTILNCGKGLATWGRSAMGLAVVGPAGALPLTPMRSATRAIISVLAWVLWPILIIQALVQICTTRRRSLSDLLAGTFVVEKPIGKRPLGRLATAAIVLSIIVALGGLSNVYESRSRYYQTKARANAELSEMQRVASLVSEHFAKTGQIETSLEALGVSDTDHALMIQPDGTISSCLSTYGTVYGELSLVPRIAGDRSITWTCNHAAFTDLSLVPKDCAAGAVPKP